MAELSWSYFLPVPPSSAPKSVADVIALAKNKPVNYASSGEGSPEHIAAEMFKAMTKTGMTHVSYKGGAPSALALISGEVDLTYENSLIITPHIKSGKVKGIAVTSAKRSALLPELPTIAETLPGYSASGWYGLLAPAATQKPVIARLHAEAVKALRAPDVVERLTAAGVDIQTTTPKAWGEFVAAEISKWSRVVKEAGVKVE